MPANRGSTRTSPAQPSTASAHPAWDTARSVIFSPQASDARKAPTRIQTFIQATEALARHKLPSLGPIPQGRLIELARRTRRGEYILQFWPNAWALLQPSLTTPQAWELGAPLGLWHSKPSSAQPPLSAIVLSGIDTSWTEATLLQEIKATNAHRLPTYNLDDGLRRAIRLNRRNPEATVGSHPSSPWIPSRSVKLIGEATLCTAILEIGALSIGCELRSIRPFETSSRACPRCLQYGHQLRYCRNDPLCRFVLGLTSPLHAPVGPLIAPLLNLMVPAPTGASLHDLPIFFCAGAWCGPWESPFAAPSIEYAAFKLFFRPLDSILASQSL